MVDATSTEADDVLDAPQRAFAAFQNVLDNANKIEVDHWMVYYTRKSLLLLLSRCVDLEWCTDVCLVSML